MEKSTHLYIHTMDTEEFCKLNFPFLPWRREKIALFSEEHKELSCICHNFLYLDFCQFLYSSEYKKPLEFHFKQENFDKKMLCDSSSMIALNLNLLHFSRLQFLSNLISKRAGLLLKNVNTGIYPSINDSTANFLYNKYNDFLKKWCFSPIFFMLFSLPYKTKIHLPIDLLSDWVLLKKDIEDILDFFNSFLHSKLVMKVLYFWLTRMHEANLWDGKDAALKTFCEKAFFYDDMENNRVYSYADYFGTAMGGQFIREYGRFLYFPVHHSQKIKNYNRNEAVDFLDKQVYDRLGSCLVAAGKGLKGKLLLDAITKPDSISDDEALQVLRFLKYYSSVHFMGHISELFGLCMAQMIENYIFDSDVVCIPGSSIFINTDKGIKQGPDGIFGNILQEDGKSELIIEGLIEVKSYQVSQKKLQLQLEQHAKRLIDNKVLLTASSLDSLGIWLPKETVGDDIDIKTFTIDKVTISKKLQYIAIVPSYKKTRQNISTNDRYHLLEMPWSPKGFKSMSLYFIIWIVENYGRIGDEDNYDKGRICLKTLLERLDESKILKRSDMYMIKNLIEALNVNIGNPDKYWFDSYRKSK